MAHYLSNNEKFHIFSKSPVLSSMAVSQAVNKSGHTVSTNDVWADDVPWFTEVADEAGAITRAADARYNDLILWGSDIYVRKGDKTNGASTGTTFAELWEKHTDLTEARAYALGSVTTQTPTNIVTKTVEIKNASDKVVLKYHVGKQIDLLTTANNANVASTWAARMFIDGKVVDQFVSPTDKVFAGNPSTGYTTLVYTADSASAKYGFVAEGEADADFVNNAFAGIVQFNQSRNDTHKFAASVFEYVGDKLDTTLGNIREEIQDIVGVTMEGVVASVTANAAAQSAGIDVDSTSKTSPKITFSGGSVASGETKLVSGGAVATAIAQAKAEAIASAEVTITAGTGIVVTGEGKGTTFQIAVSDDVATAASVSALSQTVASNKTELEGKITAAQTAASTALETAKTEIKGTTDALDTRLQTAEGKVSTLEGQVATLTTGDNSVAKQIETAATAIKGQSLAQTGTLSGMFTVQTAGTVGTGITGITITDAGLSTAISDAKQAGTDAATAVNTLKTTSVNYSTSLGSNADTVTVALGGTVGAPSVQITNVAAASALATLEQKVNAYHEAGVSYKVYDKPVSSDADLPDLSVAENVENYKNVILLVPHYGTTGNHQEPTAAISGNYVEWLCVNKGTKDAPQWAWEQIGTTEADLKDYARGIEANNKAYPVASQTGYINLGSFAATIADGQATSLANQGSVYANIATNGTLTVGVASASESVMGVSKMFTGALSPTASTVTDTAVSVKSASGMYNALSTEVNNKANKSDVVTSVSDSSYNYLAGFDVTTSVNDNTGYSVTIKHGLIGSATNMLPFNQNYDMSGTRFIKVNGNVATLQEGSQAIIEVEICPEKFVDGCDFSNGTKLESWVSDMPNLTDGTAMFKNCSKLTTFIGDLSSLETADEMFYGCTLDAESLEILADTLPTVTGGTIDIGASTNATADVIATIKGKKWTLKSNGTAL